MCKINTYSEQEHEAEEINEIPPCKSRGRFGYSTKKHPNSTTYFDCLKIRVHKGIVFAYTNKGIEKFELSKLSGFRFTII